MRAKLRNELQEYIERYTKNIQELITVKRRRGIPQWKIDEVKRLKELIKKYRTIGLINIEGVPTKQFKELRGLVSDKVYIKVTKNNLLEIALREVSLPNVDEFVKYLRGPTAVAFTNLNAFELKLLLDKTKVKREARPGDKVTSRIVVPAGNTGIPPGPMISVFGKLRIPTQVR
ncbi:MAG TPA: 50S ribosomal protein L10, partial [Acidilobales archaeon]|nr:50S ribosomal protein L10 [Acidilobales archaeon]